MAKLTEQQARRVCEALRIDPDRMFWPRPVSADHSALAAAFNSGAPAWRIAQRAAEEESR